MKTVYENVSNTDHVSGIWLTGCSKFVINLKDSNEVTTCWHGVIFRFFYVDMFLLSSLVTCPSFMSILLLVLELWQFLSIRDSSDRNPDTESTIAWVLSNTWSLGRVRHTNLARMSLLKHYWMLQTSRVTAFAISELLT